MNLWVLTRRFFRIIILPMSKKINYDIPEFLHSFDVLLDRREIFLSSSATSEEDLGIDFRAAIRFIKNIRLLESMCLNPIILHLHSIGGEWFSGIAIHDIIEQSSCRIIGIVHGCAMSIGSIILQACDLRILMPNSVVMIHRGFNSYVDVNSKELDAWYRKDKERERWMLDIYAKRCIDGRFFKENNADHKKITKFIDRKLTDKEDWILSPEEAINYGLSDGIYGETGFESIEILRNYEF